MSKYRIAIIGLGGMGGSHAAAVKSEENCELVAGADIDLGRAASWGERFGVKAIYDDYEKMLDEQRPDIVIIPTQAPMHHAPRLPRQNVVSTFSVKSRPPLTLLKLTRWLKPATSTMSSLP